MEAVSCSVVCLVAGAIALPVTAAIGVAVHYLAMAIVEREERDGD